MIVRALEAIPKARLLLIWCHIVLQAFRFLGFKRLWSAIILQYFLIFLNYNTEYLREYLIFYLPTYLRRDRHFLILNIYQNMKPITSIVIGSGAKSFFFLVNPKLWFYTLLGHKMCIRPFLSAKRDDIVSQWKRPRAQCQLSTTLKVHRIFNKINPIVKRKTGQTGSAAGRSPFKLHPELWMRPTKNPILAGPKVFKTAWTTFPKALKLPDHNYFLWWHDVQCLEGWRLCLRRNTF